MTAKDFTQGNIARQIVMLALPIMGTAFIQMAYNMTDMLWIGHVSGQAAAAVGAAGFFLWFGNSLVYTTKVGAEVGISQSLGAKNIERASFFASHAMVIAIVVSVLYGLSLFIFSKPLIGIFGFNDPAVISMAVSYLQIVAPGMIFTFLNSTFSGIYNGTGKSKIPFYANAVGLAVNIVLDPILIYGWGPFPRLEVAGAAIATVVAQAIVTLIFVINLADKKSPFPYIFKQFKLVGEVVKQVFKVGIPVTLQSGLFAIIAMNIASRVTSFGDIALAVQSVGAQIEAISWMTANGFATALASFIGQNYGASRFDRIRKGYYVTLSITMVFGLFTTIAFVFFGETIFGWFIPEPDAMREGGIYLQILGASQLFMILEIITAGAFNGTGKTMPPSIVGIVFTSLRIPAVIFLTAIIGLSGAWWSISASSMIKGVVLFIWFAFFLLRLPIERQKLTLPQRLFFRILPNRVRQSDIEGTIE